MNDLGQIQLDECRAVERLYSLYTLESNVRFWAGLRDFLQSLRIRYNFSSSDADIIEMCLQQLNKNMAGYIVDTNIVPEEYRSSVQFGLMSLIAKNECDFDQKHLSILAKQLLCDTYDCIRDLQFSRFDQDKFSVLIQSICGIPAATMDKKVVNDDASGITDLVNKFFYTRYAFMVELLNILTSTKSAFE